MSLEAFLNHYFERYIVNKQSNEQLTSDIEKAVEELLWRLLKRGLSLRVQDVIKESMLFDGTFNDILPVIRLIPTGSFFEGTRVGEPFEYDFMLQIDVEIEVQHGCFPGYVKLIYPEKWEDLSPDRILYSWNDTEYEYPALNVIFGTLLERLTENDAIMSEEEKTIRTSSGVLKALHSGGSFHIAALWTDTHQNEDVISIDVRPAFRCPKNEIDKQIGGNLPHMLKVFAEEHGVFIVPKHCINPECDRCFLISFATCEMELIKHIDDHHRKCYTILKSIISPKDMFEDALTAVETYHIKTCLLFHYYKHFPGTCEHLSLEKCVLNILEMVLESFRKMKLSTFFLRDLSIFECSSYTNYKIDFIYAKNSAIAHIIKEHGKNENEIKPSIMYLASFKLTTQILEMIHEIMLFIQTGNMNNVGTDNVFDAIEDLHFVLGHHFTGAAVETVRENKWLSSLKVHMNDIYLPIFEILRSAFMKNISAKIFARKAQFPVSIRNLDSHVPMEISEGNLGDYEAELVSSWFTISNNDSGVINYHRPK